MHINTIKANLKSLILENEGDRDDIFSDVVSFISEVMESESKGADLIKAERLDQIIKHRYYISGDAEYNKEYQLTDAARRLSLLHVNSDQWYAPMNWDSSIWEKMTSKSYRERLIIAGALIAAEIDRLDHIEA